MNSERQIIIIVACHFEPFPNDIPEKLCQRRRHRTNETIDVFVTMRVLMTEPCLTADCQKSDAPKAHRNRCLKGDIPWHDFVGATSKWITTSIGKFDHSFRSHQSPFK